MAPFPWIDSTAFGAVALAPDANDYMAGIREKSTHPVMIKK
jgi:hypothetical protein